MGGTRARGTLPRVGHRHCHSWDLGESWACAHCLLSNCTDLQDQEFSSRMPKSKSPHFPAVVKSFPYLSEQYPSGIKSQLLPLPAQSSCDPRSSDCCTALTHSLPCSQGYRVTLWDVLSVRRVSVPVLYVC